MKAYLCVFACWVSAAGCLRAFPADSAAVAYGMGLALSQQYGRAAAVFDSLAADSATALTGAFYRTVVEYTRLSDNEDFFRDSLFNAAAGRTGRLLEGRMQAGGTAEAYYMAGTVAGYRGLLAIKQGSWLRGLRTGLKSMGLLERAVSLDSTLADAYWSLGIYRYYSGKMAARFSWLPFVEGGGEEGLALIRRTVEKGRYARAAAELALAWLYYDEKEYDAALAAAGNLRARYPDNRMFMWPQGDILFAMGRNDEAAACFRLLLERLERHEPENVYHQALCRWKLAQLCRRSNEPAAARTGLEALLAMPMDRRTAERFEPFRVKARALLKDLQRDGKTAD